MKRIIKDFKSISDDIVALINEQYPYGYEENELVTFVNAKGEFIKALEVKTDEVKYLIKLSQRLDEHINDYIDSDEEEDTSYVSEDGIPDDMDGSSEEDDD